MCSGGWPTSTLVVGSGSRTIASRISFALNFSARSVAKSNARYDASESSNATRIFLIIFPSLSFRRLRDRCLRRRLALVPAQRWDQVSGQEPGVADDGRDDGAADHGRHEV